MALSYAEEAVRPTSMGRQIVAMNVGDEVYGIDINFVHTVILPQPITSVPRTPRHVRGVINLRGRVVPIVDLRIRFGLPEIAEGDESDRRIVMVDVEGNQTGLIVDGVSEVIMLPEESIEPPSEYLAPETAYVSAIARAPIAHRVGDDKSEGPRNERLILLLDVHKAILGAEEGQYVVASSEELAAEA